MRIEFESCACFNVYWEDGYLHIATDTVDGNRVCIYTLNKRHIKSLLEELKKRIEEEK